MARLHPDQINQTHGVGCKHQNFLKFPDNPDMQPSLQPLLWTSPCTYISITWGLLNHRFLVSAPYILILQGWGGPGTLYFHQDLGDVATLRSTCLRPNCKMCTGIQIQLGFCVFFWGKGEEAVIWHCERTHNPIKITLYPCCLELMIFYQDQILQSLTSNPDTQGCWE